MQRLTEAMAEVATVRPQWSCGSAGGEALYRELYFIPIILVSFRYGLKKGFYTAVVVISLYFPHILLTWRAQPGVNIGNLLQILVFILGGRGHWIPRRP